MISEEDNVIYFTQSLKLRWASSLQLVGAHDVYFVDLMGRITLFCSLPHVVSVALHLALFSKKSSASVAPSCPTAWKRPCRHAKYQNQIATKHTRPQLPLFPLLEYIAMTGKIPITAADDERVCVASAGYTHCMWKGLCDLLLFLRVSGCVRLVRTLKGCCSY